MKCRLFRRASAPSGQERAHRYLMSYGPNPVENNRRTANFVDKILKRAKPGTCRSSGQRRSRWWSISKQQER